MQSGRSWIVAVPYLTCLILISAVWSQAAQSTPALDPNRAQPISIVVRLEGFETRTISLPAGRYLFAMLNRSGFQNLALALEKMPGNSIAGTASQQSFSEPVDAVKNRLLKSVQLTPGTYRLREVHHDHPAWLITIRVQ
ncbi:MAG: hypothetical protein LAP40_24750 [Acidobacteriia bacterium]|nr:hypothetical protein [Terriglobia bacterium]